MSAPSVDPSADNGRLVRKRADSSVKLLARMSDNFTGGKCGGRGRGVRVQDSGRSISVAQCVNRARVTVIQAVVILASPSTGLSLQYCSM